MPRISDLPAAGALTGTEEVPVVQSGVTKRSTPAAINQLSLVPTGNRVFAGANDSTNSWIFQSGGFLSGAATNPADGLISPYHLFIQGDTVTCALLIGLSMNHRVNAGHTGERTVINAQMFVQGVPGDAGSYAYVGLGTKVKMLVNMGGVAGYANAKGAAFGANPTVATVSPATFLGRIVGTEVNVSVVAGTSCTEKYGISVVKIAADAVRGTYDDAAISIGEQDSTSISWLRGISFGTYAGKWAFDVDSTLIGAQVRTLPAPNAPVALYGVDFSTVAFQAGGAAFKSDGWLVGPSGFMDMVEQAAPAAPAANTARLWVQDNGGGKTQLMVQFNTGAAQQLAIQA